MLISNVACAADNCLCSAEFVRGRSPRCGFGEQFCRAVITGKGDLSIAKGYRTTIERCLESFDKAPDGKDLALRVALSASTEKSAHKGCFSYYNKAKRQWQTDELPDRRHCNAPPAKRGSQSSIIMKRSGVRNPPPCGLFSN